MTTQHTPDSESQPTHGRLPTPENGTTRNGLARWLPGLFQLLHYESAWLRHDITAGPVLSVMLVPVGIAYAVAAGLPGINGLYATIAGLIPYALFGPNRRLVYGPDSALAALILAVVLPLSGGDPARAIALAGAMALVSGAVCVLGGLARLGFIIQLLSAPIRYGYMNGIAIVVLVSQLPALFGFQAEGENTLLRFWQFLLGLFNGQTNFSALAVVVLLRNSNKIPGILIAIVGATVVTGMLQLDAHGVKVLGSVPQGLPRLVLPIITYDDLIPVLMGGLAVYRVFGRHCRAGRHSRYRPCNCVSNY